MENLWYEVYSVNLVYMGNCYGNNSEKKGAGKTQTNKLNTEIEHLSSSTHTVHQPASTSNIPETIKEFTISAGKLTTCNKKSDTIVIPNEVLSIEDYTFKNNPDLKKIIIPVSTKSIGKGAFVECKNLLHIEMSDNVELIGEHAFSKCTSLESIKLPAKISSIEQQTFSECTNLQNIILPQTISIIGNSAFSHCTNLENIILPEKLCHIGEFAFAYCNKLTNITIPNGVKNISDFAFTGCKNLENVTLSNNLEKIGNSVFYNCKSLKNIELPYGVTNIESRAFADCDNLTRITIPESVNYICDTAFDGCNKLFTIRAPEYSFAERYAKINNIRFSPIVANNAKTHTVREIEFADFVVRSNTSSCYLNHDVETIEAFVNILAHDGSTRKIKTIAAHCKNCNCYYIMESSFKYLQKKGVLLCQLITLSELKSKGSAAFNNERKKTKSMLRRYGYTVSATTGLSTIQRQTILSLVLDNHIYSASELYSFLDWLISYHGKSKHRDMSNAIEKWTNDRNFVANYRVSSRRSVGIHSISYHPKT